MSGPKEVLVSKVSATYCRHWEDGPGHICAIQRTHSEMVKFAPHDPVYAAIRVRLQGLSQRALTVRERIQAKTKCM